MAGVSDETVACCRNLDCADVARVLDLPEARPRHKYACPACASSDALHIYPGDDSHGFCFSCKTHFDAIALVEATTGKDFKDAVGWLAEQFGFAKQAAEESTDYRQRIRERIQKRDRARRRRRRERRRAARPVYQKIYEELELGRVGREYLESRAIEPHKAEYMGLRSVESLEQWKSLLGAFWPDEVLKAGLQGQDNGDVYPVPWSAPFLVLDYRQQTDDDPPEPIDILRFRHLDGTRPKYLSPLGLQPAGPFLRHSFGMADSHPELFVCEGELDALSVVVSGAPAVASPGSSGWEEGWSERFRWFDRVTVLCDGDDAGRQFSSAVRDATVEALGPDWTDERFGRVVLGDGMDANDLKQEGTLQEIVDV